MPDGPPAVRRIRVASGIGLGLSIVDDCVRAMGGHIDVRSREGEGTVFVFTLPLRPPTT